MQLGNPQSFLPSAFRVLQKYRHPITCTPPLQIRPEYDILNVVVQKAQQNTSVRDLPDEKQN